MEATVVLIFSGLGCFVTGFQVVDSIRDSWIVHHTDPPRQDLYPIAQQLLIQELVILLVQIIFFLLALDAIVEAQITGTSGLLFLLAVPIILTAHSIYSRIIRKKRLREEGIETKLGSRDPE